MSYSVKTLIPQLPMLDIEATKKYYTEELGCKVESEYPDFLIVDFEGLILHFWLCDNKAIPESSSFYAIVEDIEKMYEKYSTTKGLMLRLCMQPWGMREFYLMDNSGNLLKFGERIAQ